MSSLALEWLTLSVILTSDPHPLCLIVRPDVSIMHARAGRTGRRRSSLLPAMERAASLTLISALGSHPSLYTMGSSSDEDDVTSRDLTRTVSQDPTLRSAISISTLDSVFTIEGKTAGDGYLTSDTEMDNECSSRGLDNPVFVSDPKDPVSLNAAQQDDVESGRFQLLRRLHDRLSEKPSVVSVVSETSSSSGSGADSAALDVPPHYHEVISKQVATTIHTLSLSSPPPPK